jgi:hypothetical protein
MSEPMHVHSRDIGRTPVREMTGDELHDLLATAVERSLEREVSTTLEKAIAKAAEAAVKAQLADRGCMLGLTVEDARTVSSFARSINTMTQEGARCLVRGALYVLGILIVLGFTMWVKSR